MSPASHNHETTHRARTFGAAVATVAIVGLAGLIFLHAERQSVHAGTTGDVAPAAVIDSAPTAFLHAPAMDSSVPSADQVFASRRAAPADAGDAAPTF